MADSKRRKKMISLRLSEAEYEVLKKDYRIYGARNVSDLARLALQRIMHGSIASHDGFSAKLADLDDRVHALESLCRAPAAAETMNCGAANLGRRPPFRRPGFLPAQK
jgi:hypothetical protein